MKRVLAAMFASTLLLAACGGSDSEGSGSTDSTTEFNDADVAFAQGMIPHHEQAVEMADLALESAESDEVTSLAEEIKAAQDPEIETMQGWLDDWDRPDSGGERMIGMMSDQEMADLGAASGAEFDQMFLDMMIEHHTGAISMAETEQADGENADAKALAGQIIDAQEAEITEMESLLDGGA
jgi:uncharacterized protein (DUF305 family)